MVAPRQKKSGSNRFARIAGGVAIALLLIGLGALLVWNERAERHAIERLPDAERHALFLRTKANLEQVCDSPSDALRDFCREQAEFLAKFPECDASCRALVAHQRPREPSR